MSCRGELKTTSEKLGKILGSLQIKMRTAIYMQFPSKEKCSTSRTML